ncbi:calcineurin-like phosphoesterase [Colletotrichum plurivorum]|uniref:Calcineurin-like phosphoesterase n=1 Tax=Colletotrichum plurivorum TaxID=2175906 RepID=A0A8H6NH10_9PEZI|nr:calcineurin-like phosphoesterase [Colletotrichum plurivorum]
MSIQILSDLHLESPKAYDIFEVVPKAPILALLGDIGYVGTHKDDYLTFLNQQLSQFRAFGPWEPRGLPLRLATNPRHPSRLRRGEP